MPPSSRPRSGLRVVLWLFASPYVVIGALLVAVAVFACAALLAQALSGFLALLPQPRFMARPAVLRGAPRVA